MAFPADRRGGETLYGSLASYDAPLGHPLRLGSPSRDAGGRDDSREATVLWLLAALADVPDVEESSGWVPWVVVTVVLVAALALFALLRRRR